jgi:hypothetical protein
MYRNSYKHIQQAGVCGKARGVDDGRFDDMARHLSSRRTALGGLLVGLLIPLEAASRKKGRARQNKGKGKRKGAGKDQHHAVAQADSCWRAGACIPKKGANVSQCNLAGYAPPATLDCTGCNVSRANLRGASLRGAKFPKANLSGSCLVDADLTGATFANNTNLANAIFCRTTMPDGNVNDSGCNAGTPCCPTCDAAHLCSSGCCNTAAGACGACPNGWTCGGGGTPGVCGCTAATCGSLGKQCGSWPDGCGGTLSCGNCPSGATQTCNAGACATCSATCPAECFMCLQLVDGSSLCADNFGLACVNCRSNADCPANVPVCATAWTRQSNNSTTPMSSFCSGATTACIDPYPC